MRKTKTSAVLEQMLAGGSITSMQAFMWFRATRLSAIIFELRKRGFNVITTERREGSVSWAEYSIPKDKQTL